MNLNVIKDIDRVMTELTKLREEVYDMLRANREMKNMLDGVHSRPLAVEAVTVSAPVKPTAQLVDDLIKTQKKSFL